MIKVFVTVGTTPFDNLIKFCDDNIDFSKFEVIAQVSKHSKYNPQNIKTIDFVKNIDTFYDAADIVISHAGAGSVFKLLEKNKKSIFVNNYTMKDNHQEDICRFVQDNNYALVLDFNLDLNYVLYSLIKKEFLPYLSSKESSIIENIFNLMNIEL